MVPRMTVIVGLVVATLRAEPSVVVAPVSGVSQIEPVAAIRAGRRQGIAMGDRAAIVDGTRIIATGEVFLLDDTGCAVRLSTPLPADTTDTTPATRPFSTATRPYNAALRAVLVPASFVARAKAAMPAGTTIVAATVGTGPGRRQLWIDVGGLGGLAENDSVWIRRDDFPIARGRVVLVMPRTALVQPRPLVTNAVPDIGDLVDLWPSPAMRRTNRPETIVMEVTPTGEGASLKLAGARRDGLRPGRQLELYDGEAYVGLAGVVTSSDRLCIARSMRAFCTTQPTVGLRAIARAADPDGAAPLAARVFDVRSGYVLIAAGGADGVQPGQTFAVIREGNTVARLEAKTVEVDFTSAVVLPAEDGEPPQSIEKWDVAVREPIPRSPIIRIGTVTGVWRGGDWIIGAMTTADNRVRPGDVLRIAAETPVAAIVAVHEAGKAVLYVPPGWGRATITPDLPIERSDP